MQPRPAQSPPGPPTGDLLRVAFEVAVENDVDEAYRRLAAQINREYAADAVLLGVCPRDSRRCRLQTVTGVTQVKPDSPLAQSAAHLLSETCCCDAISQFDESTPSSAATDAQRQLTQLCQAKQVVSGPIHNHNGEVIGAWALVRRRAVASADGLARQTGAVDSYVELSRRLSPCLELLERLRATKAQRIASALFGKHARRRRRLLAGVAVALTCLMALPMPYRVSCDCVVQATTRRYVAAPYAGVLQQVLVEPGDVVHKGQVLARMDGREIAWELAARQAQLERAKKEHDVQLAGRQTAAAQVAKLEMEQLQIQIQMLENRAANLEIRCPIDGVVTRGDARRQESARLDRGSTLFEIAPLDSMAVDVLVPDEEISYVRPEQEVEIRLDAIPGAVKAGVIRRITPQAELRNQQNVFVAEVRLENSAGTLRPGMAGRSHIKTATRPLGWNLFHRAWDNMISLAAW